MCYMVMVVNSTCAKFVVVFNIWRENKLVAHAHARFSKVVRSNSQCTLINLYYVINTLQLYFSM